MKRNGIGDCTIGESITSSEIGGTRIRRSSKRAKIGSMVIENSIGRGKREGRLHCAICGCSRSGGLISARGRKRAKIRSVSIDDSIVRSKQLQLGGRVDCTIRGTGTKGICGRAENDSMSSRRRSDKIRSRSRSKGAVGGRRGGERVHRV